MKKMMHLNGFVIHSPMNHSVGSWTHPDNKIAESFAQPDIWQGMARTLERGKFDAIFLPINSRPMVTTKIELTNHSRAQFNFRFMTRS